MSRSRLLPRIICVLGLFGPGAALARTFHNRQGQAIEAEVVALSGANVTLLRSDGKSFTLPVANLSDDDQAFLTTWQPAAPPAPVEPAPASKPAPATRLQIDFPRLTVDRYGKPATCHLILPAGFTPTQTYPLVVWLGGGEGGNQPNASFLPAGDFILAGFPYPKGASNPFQGNMVGDFKTLWKYHQAMLKELHQRFPNIDRSRSIIAGFSNGGHAIDGMLKVQSLSDSLDDYFGIFILADGGGFDSDEGKYPKLKGKFAYLSYGETSGNRDTVPFAANAFKTSGAQTTLSEITATGHAFPAAEKEKIKTWLEKTVFPALRPSDAPNTHSHSS